MQMTAFVHDDETGGYWAEVQELPGCFTQRDSLDELQENLKEVIELFLDGLIRDYVLSIPPQDQTTQPETPWVFELSLRRRKRRGGGDPPGRRGQSNDLDDGTAKNFKPGRVFVNVPKPIAAPMFGPPVKERSRPSVSRTSPGDQRL